MVFTFCIFITISSKEIAYKSQGRNIKNQYNKHKGECSESYQPYEIPFNSSC